MHTMVRAHAQHRTRPQRDAEHVCCTRAPPNPLARTLMLRVRPFTAGVHGVIMRPLWPVSARSGNLVSAPGLRAASSWSLGSHELSGVTGMIMTVRVADSGLRGTVPKAKRLLARRRRRKF